MTARDALDAIGARLEAPLPYPESLLLSPVYADLAALHAALESVLAQIDAFEDRYCGDDHSPLSLIEDLRSAIEAVLEPKEEA